MHPYPKIRRAHRDTIPAVWYDRCVTKCTVVKGLISPHLARCFVHGFAQRRDKIQR